MVAKHRHFVVLKCKSSQIIANVLHKCRTWFIMCIGDMGSHQRSWKSREACLQSKPEMRHKYLLEGEELLMDLRMSSLDEDVHLLLNFGNVALSER